jgi:hypothetical protein
MASWQLDKLHMFVTSRKEYQIEQTISPIAGNAILFLEDTVVDRDIHVYISERLQTDQKLRRWRDRLDIQDEILTTLTAKCGGM